MVYPSEILNRMVESSTKQIYYYEQMCLEYYVSYVGKMSGTLYQKLFSCLQKEPLEHSVLLRTEFLAKALVPNSFFSKFYDLLKLYHYYPVEEILKCMKDIAVWHGEENISFWTKTPWIKEVARSSTSYLLHTIKEISRLFLPLYPIKKK